MNGISIVIPARNEETRIGEVVRRASKYANEVLVIDDGSVDHTAQVAEEAGARLIRQSHLGYIGAVKNGFQAARGDIIVTLDADGEFPEECIPALVAPIRDEIADMVQGHRDRIPRISERFLSWLASRKGPVGDSGTGFRAIRAGLARKLTLRGECICGIFSLEVISQQGSIVEIPIRLNQVDKHRRTAWYHIKQLLFLLPWLFRRYKIPAKEKFDP
jgi:glycosyltransferase involved in cell wall biosynthesis